MTDWPAIARELASSQPGLDTDDHVDSLAGSIFAGHRDSGASEALQVALQQAESQISRRSAALALAYVAASDDAASVDALVAAYRGAADNEFLAPALLEALGLLALRCSLARAEVVSSLLRLRPTAPRNLLIKAAKIIGRLDNVQRDTNLRAKLGEFLGAADAEVLGETHYQLALINFGDALLSASRAEFDEMLASARAGFARAEALEEHRPDAQLFVRLTDILLAFKQLASSRAATYARIRQLAAEATELAASGLGLGWWDYRSDTYSLLMARVDNLVRALKRAAEAVQDTDEWTNFSEALVELAALYAVIRSASSVVDAHGHIGLALSAVSDVVLVPDLGPVLAQAITQVRFSKVVAQYAASTDPDQVKLAGLRALEHEVMRMNGLHVASPHISATIAKVAELSRQAGMTPEAFVSAFTDAVRQNQTNGFAERIGLSPAALPVERPELYHPDAKVDHVVRKLLRELRDLLGPGGFAPVRWMRLVSSVVSIVGFVESVRDRLPKYALCSADGGKGQSASEGDLQEDLFEALRRVNDGSVEYEWTRVGGGRVDVGLRFPECAFPIEVKHEFSSIKRAHVRQNYAIQPDIYASVTDRIAFLLILDLRARNAFGHVDEARRHRNQEQEEGHEYTSLYPLLSSFWVESLPVDPDIPSVAPNAVIIGLVTGNRVLPSSTTSYSRRPQNARQSSARKAVQ